MGQLIEVIPKTRFEFDGRTSSTQQVVLRDNIPTLGFASGELLVRVHGASGFTASAFATVTVYNQSHDRNDPATFFVAASALTESSSINSSSVAGELLVSSFEGPISASVRVVLDWAQGGTPATAVQTVTLAVDLVGRG